MRAAGTASASGRATADPVIVIAEMDHEIGPVGGRVRGNRGERPGGRAAAILDRTPFEPTAGIADHNDTLHLRRHDWQYRAADGKPRRVGGRQRLANLDREIAVGRSAALHRETRAIRADHRTGSARHDRAHRQPAICGELDPGWCGLGGARNASSHQQREECGREPLQAGHDKAEVAAVQLSSFMPFCTAGRAPTRSPQAAMFFSPAPSINALRPA